MIGGMVSCLMITQASRAELAKRAIACFERQTYHKRELVIVTDDELSGPLRTAFRAPMGLTLGDLRNFAVSRAQGEFVACWDDDDWHHPDRLSLQMLALTGPVYTPRTHEFDGCTLSRWTIADLRSKLVVHSEYRSRGWEGSLVARRYRQPCYPALARGEDTPVVVAMKITSIDEPHLYVYNVHGQNTFDPPHFDRMFHRATKVLEGVDKETVIRNLTS